MVPTLSPIVDGPTAFGRYWVYPTKGVSRGVPFNDREAAEDYASLLRNGEYAEAEGVRLCYGA